MGISSSLFFDRYDSQKQTLYRRIIPTEDQFEEQQERWSALADHLTSALSEKSGNTITTWLQGSYKFGTQIRPVRAGEEFDIDLGIYFVWEGDPSDGDYGPKALKGMVQESLSDYSSDSVIEVISPPKIRCARIRFKGDFHIDVPAYHLDDERDTRTLATEEDEWEESDPKALYIWFKSSFDDDRRTIVRRQIRYLKTWAALKFSSVDSRPSSTLITVLVAEAAVSLSKERFSEDDDTLQLILGSIVDRLDYDRTVLNPVDPDEDLAGRLEAKEYDSFIDSLKELQKIADEALGEADVSAAADKWSDAFEHFFPLPDVEAIDEEVSKTQHLPVRAFNPEVDVTAVSRDNPNHKWSGRNAIGPIPKNCDIYFQITNSGAMPPNSVVQWMVRNEGDEAEIFNDLGHRAGTGVTAKERSAYRGTHHMDCVVRQYGIVIGRRRIPVRITGMAMARRNPLKLPQWVRLRGRR
ncbi:hypothetical protein FRZ44_12060 [Hypericibacter terrae]|uniref:Cyclic GMP-AMP synthase n=1 Tax=Hypericibacter terrae TaxID=2602015 RepID=A0A5J6MFS0_9PROT|nr:nucleotidyltransferase [Hypericibacter terrae]QEX15917.1 hypothetical protein FRZ44_12060 [Hypericibacter terrae]